MVFWINRSLAISHALPRSRWYQALLRDNISSNLRVKRKRKRCQKWPTPLSQVTHLGSIIWVRTGSESHRSVSRPVLCILRVLRPVIYSTTPGHTDYPLCYPLWNSPLFPRHQGVRNSIQINNGHLTNLEYLSTEHMSCLLYYGVINKPDSECILRGCRWIWMNLALNL